MDIFSHGLWTGAACKIANQKLKKPLKIRWAVLWGMFPDLFAFTIPFVWILVSAILGQPVFKGFPQPEEIEPMSPDTSIVFKSVSLLYSLSHSLIIFLLVFALVYFIFKRPVWMMGGWLFHILIDIPTHSYKFYPTPFLWPVSSWKFNGLSWATPWFLIVNYSVLAIVYLFLFLRKNTGDVN